MYKIPDKYFFRLHHVRSRFKTDVEEVLLYVATSISNLEASSKKQFDANLNGVLFNFKKNKTLIKKTIDNWRTEISAFFGFIQSENGKLRAGDTAKRLAKNQYLDEFFNYFLLTFQYPGGFLREDKLADQLENKINFKPCPYIINILKEGEKILGKAMSITKEELTYCAFFDLRVTSGNRIPEAVAKLILDNKKKKIDYSKDYYDENGKLIESGFQMRQAGDILDYMVFANLLNHKGVGRYYFLNENNKNAIEYHVKNKERCKLYDSYLGTKKIDRTKLAELRED